MLSTPYHFGIIVFEQIIFTVVLTVFMCLSMQKFSQFLKTGGESSLLVRILEKVEGHLREYGTRYMLGDSLTRADCYLLPTLQHIRVAGKVTCQFCQWIITLVFEIYEHNYVSGTAYTVDIIIYYENRARSTKHINTTII